MNETTRAIRIDAAVPAVWEVLVDVRRMPDLSPSTEAVEAPPRLTGVGDRFDQTVRVAGRRITSTWTVTAFEERRLLEIEGKVGPGTRMSMRQEVEAAGTHASTLRVTMRWKLPFGPLGRLAGRLGLEQRALAEQAAVLDGVRRLAEADRAGAQDAAAAGAGAGVGR